MPDAMREASPAVRELCRLFHERVRAERERLGTIAFATDGLSLGVSVDDGWRLDVGNGTFVRTLTVDPNAGHRGNDD